jgi:hypothetical protein
MRRGEFINSMGKAFYWFVQDHACWLGVAQEMKVQL